MDEGLYSDDQGAQAEFYAESQYCGPYLKERGIRLETIHQNGIQLRPSRGEDRILASEYRRILGFDNWHTGPLHEIIEESIWFPCRDANRTVQ